MDFYIGLCYSPYVSQMVMMSLSWNEFRYCWFESQRSKVSVSCFCFHLTSNFRWPIGSTAHRDQTFGFFFAPFVIQIRIIAISDAFHYRLRCQYYLANFPRLLADKTSVWVVERYAICILYSTKALKYVVKLISYALFTSNLLINALSVIIDISSNGIGIGNSHSSNNAQR